MLTVSPALGLPLAIKTAFGAVTPLLIAIAGLWLCRSRPLPGLCLLLSAALILIGFAGPLLAAQNLQPGTRESMLLACHSGWFLAGVVLVLLGFEHHLASDSPPLGKQR